MSNGDLHYENELWFFGELKEDNDGNKSLY